MQAKDVPELAVLRFLADTQDRTEAATAITGLGWIGAGWHELEGPGYIPSVRAAIPAGTPDRVVLAKMRALIRRGLVDGCPCGCRGDFSITDKGRAFLTAATAESASRPSP